MYLERNENQAPLANRPPSFMRVFFGCRQASGSPGILLGTRADGSRSLGGTDPDMYSAGELKKQTNPKTPQLVGSDRRGAAETLSC